MSQVRLLKSKRFSPLFWTQFLGAFNDNFLKNALIILIMFKSSGVFGLSAEDMVPLSGGLFILPFFLFSATSGQLADKFEKSFLISIVKSFEIFLMGLALIGFYFQNIYFLMFVLFML